MACVPRARSQAHELGENCSTPGPSTRDVKRKQYSALNDFTRLNRRPQRPCCLGVERFGWRDELIQPAFRH
jgi:hypothetical protein